MTELDRAALEKLGVSRETMERLETLVALVREESTRQNLISAASSADIWHRHIIDSLQLLPLALDEGRWLDIGTGAGFPGLVVAVAAPTHQLTLVEPRPLRADFLARAVVELGIEAHVQVVTGKVERMSQAPFAVISARAVARIDRLFDAAHHLSQQSTVWLLPKGRSVRDELAAARQTWQGRFRLEPSLTDANAAIVVATAVQRRTKR